jgi:hypothetical protein
LRNLPRYLSIPSQAVFAISIISRRDDAKPAIKPLRRPKKVVQGFFDPCRIPVGGGFP